MAATIKGIDVSMHQTNVDFAKVKAAATVLLLSDAITGITRRTV